MEGDAAEHLGLRISKIGFDIFLKKLFNPETGKGFLVRGGVREAEMRARIDSITKLSAGYFHKLSSLLSEKNTDCLRLRKTGLATDTVSEEIYSFSKHLAGMAKTETDENYRQELESYTMKAEFYADAFYRFSNMTFENYVYWIEANSFKGNGRIEIFAAPLKVKELLNKIIFNNTRPVILTSATLSVGGDLEYYCGRVGYCNGEKSILDTLFDYQRQMKIYISKVVPEPNDAEYLDLMCEEIRKYTSLTHGKAFVLFTSYDILRKCAAELRDFFAKKGIKLLVQGENLSRNNMLKEFRGDTDSVIFGAASFWAGVDVPGESLSNVIITKLPFDVPSHPLIQARSELIEADGGDSFKNYLLPEAVLKFRQGIGRLIRNKRDTGIVAILDKRILTKNYGRAFLNSIPKCHIEVSS
jgi:ATP-dependent DNA helicase DinG